MVEIGTDQNILTEKITIPDDWNFLQIKEIAKVIRGASPRPKGDSRYYGGDVPRLMVEDVTRDGKFVTPIVDFLTKEGEKRSRPCKKGDLTIVCSGTVGIPSFLDTDACIHDGFLALIDIKKNIYKDYLYHQLSSLRTTFESSATHGGIFTNLTTTIMEDFSVPFPPNKEEQIAIAQSLSNIDKMINDLANLIEKKKNILKGIMQELLTGKRRLEGFSTPWSYKSFEELFDFLKTGSNSRDDLSPNGDFGYIHYGDIHSKWNQFLDCQVEEIPNISKEKVKHLPLLKEGDLIMVDASEDYAGIGACVLIKNIRHKKIVSGLHTIFLRNDKTKLSSDYSIYLTSIRDVKRRLIEITTGISVYGLSKNQLKKIKVYLPNDIDEQIAITTILFSMDLEIKELETKKDKYVMIKHGMMKKLLTGEIRLK